MKKLLNINASFLSKSTRTLLEDIKKKKFSLTDSDSFESMCDLAYGLYVDNQLDEAKEVCDKFVNCEFQGNYDFWTWVEYALALSSRIASANGGSEIENVFFKRQVLSAIESGDEEKVKLKRKIHARYLNGNQVNFDKVQLAIDRGDVESELDWRTVYLKNQISLEQFGSTNIALAEKITLDIENNLLAIRKLNAAA
jgi:hypothetical protein